MMMHAEDTPIIAAIMVYLIFMPKLPEFEGNIVHVAICVGDIEVFNRPGIERYIQTETKEILFSGPAYSYTSIHNPG